MELRMPLCPRLGYLYWLVNPAGMKKQTQKHFDSLKKKCLKKKKESLDYGLSFPNASASLKISISKLHC